jgi:hypothetical protein
MKERAPAPHGRPHGFMPGRLRDLRRWEAPVEAYDSPQIVGMDLNLQRALLPSTPKMTVTWRPRGCGLVR